MDIQQIINVNINKKDMMATKTWLKLNKNFRQHNNDDNYGTISNHNNIIINKHNSHHNQQIKIQTSYHPLHHQQHHQNNITTKQSKSFTNIEQLFAAV